MADVAHISGRSSVPVDLGFSRPRRAVGGGGGDEPRAGDVFFRQKKAEAPQVGFGANTISAPAAALHTIGYGLKSAKQIVPTPEELQQQVRERTAEQREAQVARIERSGARFDVTVGGEGGREFIAAVNGAAATAQARLSGEGVGEPVSASI